MKNKSLMFLMTVTLVIAAFALAGPASAGKRNHDHGRALFEADIVPMGSQPLDKGEVYIREDGTFKVEIEGAIGDTVYDVYLVFASLSLPTYLGELETDDEGEGKLYSNYDCINIDGFVRMPWIEIYMSGQNPNFDDPQYVSGFAPVQCASPSSSELPFGIAP